MLALACRVSSQTAGRRTPALDFDFRMKAQGVSCGQAPHRVRSPTDDGEGGRGRTDAARHQGATTATTLGQEVLRSLVGSLGSRRHAQAAGTHNVMPCSGIVSSN